MNEQQKEQLKEKWLAFENAYDELFYLARTINPKYENDIQSIINYNGFFDFKAELRDLGILETEDDG